MGDVRPNAIRIPTSVMSADHVSIAMLSHQSCNVIPTMLAALREPKELKYICTSMSVGPASRKMSHVTTLFMG